MRQIYLVLSPLTFDLHAIRKYLAKRVNTAFINKISFRLSIYQTTVFGAPAGNPCFVCNDTAHVQEVDLHFNFPCTTLRRDSVICEGSDKFSVKFLQSLRRCVCDKNIFLYHITLSFQCSVHFNRRLLYFSTPNPTRSLIVLFCFTLPL